MERDDPAGSHGVGELRYSLSRVGLIHEHAAADDGVERAAFWKGNVESAFEESDIGDARLTSLLSPKVEHASIAIDSKHMSVVSNATCDHERYRPRPAADIEHVQASPDACIIEHSFSHVIDGIQHLHAIHSTNTSGLCILPSRPLASIAGRRNPAPQLTSSRKSVIASGLGFRPRN